MAKFWLKATVALLAVLVFPLATLDAQMGYTVQPGDSLSRIAYRNGVTVSEIMEANSLANPNVIFVGQVLLIPEATVTPVDTGVIEPVPVLPDPVPIVVPAADPIVIPSVAPTAPPPLLPTSAPIYSNISGTADFVAQMTRVIQWIERNDPGAFALLIAYTDGIIASNQPSQAFASYTLSGDDESCIIEMFYIVDDVLTASVLHHEVIHCMRGYQRSWGTAAEEEVIAYTEQKFFLQRHGVDPAYVDQIEQSIGRHAELAAHGG